jgi:hypothetical protein
VGRRLRHASTSKDAQNEKISPQYRVVLVLEGRQSLSKPVMQSLTGRLLNLGGARVSRADSTPQSQCSIRMLAVRFKVESHENLSCYCSKSITAPRAACRGTCLTESRWLKARHVVSYRALGPASAMLLSGTITALKNARKSSSSCHDRNGMFPAFSSLHSFVRVPL